MDLSLIEMTIFLIGAGCGAALNYLKDRQLLHFYGDLVRQLSVALKQQVEYGPGAEAEALARLLREQAEQVREHGMS